MTVLFLCCLYISINYIIWLSLFIYMYSVQIIIDQGSNKTSECMYPLQKLMSMSVVYRDDAMVVCTMITHQIVAYYKHA